MKRIKKPIYSQKYILKNLQIFDNPQKLATTNLIISQYLLNVPELENTFFKVSLTFYLHF